MLNSTAGTESLEEYFQKGALFGSKSGTKSLVGRNQAKFSKTVPEHLKVWHTWFRKIVFLVILTTEKRQLNYVNKNYN